MRVRSLGTYGKKVVQIQSALSAGSESSAVVEFAVLHFGLSPHSHEALSQLLSASSEEKMRLSRITPVEQLQSHAHFAAAGLQHSVPHSVVPVRANAALKE